MRGVGCAGCGGAGEDRGRAAVMHVGRREIAQAAVMVGVVVPREQVVRDGAGVFEGAEAIGKLRPVFERAELGFGKRIVIAHARPCGWR